MPLAILTILPMTQEFRTMRSDVPARRGPTPLFGAPLGPTEKFLFEMAALPNDASRPSAPKAGAADPAAHSPRPRSAPQPRPCSER